MKENIAGRIAAAFLESKLTPLIMAFSLALGVWTVFTLASEEEPQIIVPLADLYLPLEGAEPREVENRVLIPLEGILSGIEGVEYVYTRAEHGFGLATVRYEVGRNMEESLVRLMSTLSKHTDRLPPEVGLPMVRTVTIDDVPFFTATLHGELGEMDGATLRRMADEVRVELSALPNVRDVQVIGGYPRELRVELDPERLAHYGIDPLHVAQRLRGENVETRAGEFSAGNQVVRVTAGGFLADAEQVGSVVLDVRDGALIQVRDVAVVRDGPAEVTHYTLHRTADADGWRPMVAVSVSKRPGADATELGRALETRIAGLEGRVLADGVEVAITRNYGETARDKVVTLQWHLVLAVLSVGLVILLTMGWRAALVVVLSVPLTFALTLFVYQLFGYTLNRVTLFALIFVTGIVVDDSIIISENMERHFRRKARPLRAAAIAAVGEVGNPTILATLTVIAAVLPMLFVSGLMGPYMSPMPIGSTVAMVFSLGLALTVTPWLAFKLLGSQGKPKPIMAMAASDGSGGGGNGGTGGENGEGSGSGDDGEGADGKTDEGTALNDEAHDDEASEARLAPPRPSDALGVEGTRIYRLYDRVMSPLLARPWALGGTLGVVGLLLLGAVGMFFTRAVEVKMLPFDDKNEVQIIVDMPEGTSLETTLALAADIGDALVGVPEVTDIQLYAGTAAPINFNGMIRQYYLRDGAHVADLQVNLVDKTRRRAQSHDVALALRPLVDEVVAASGTGARAKVVEVPPGPPVLSTLVAEIYGDDEAEQIRVAREVMERFEAMPGVVDVDWSLTAPQTEMRMTVDAEQAALSGIAKEQVVGAVEMALRGQVVSRLSTPNHRTTVPLRVGLAEADRSSVERLGRMHLGSANGAMVPLAELVTTEETVRHQSISRKNGKRVIYVMGEVAGELESPVYAMLDMAGSLDEIQVAGGGSLGRLFTREPAVTERPVMKWDGEWQVTYEVFRDLGIAFAGAILLIYVLIVAWFGSFVTPLVMMAAIPLTLIGIAPGHFITGAFFTATSMIGMIALAGIMVRNGILLIDYLEARLRVGVPLKKAILEAGAVRTRPILVTAVTVIIGAVVILFDPIFQGLAVSLMAGAFASTILTLVVVPGLYFLIKRGWREEVTP
ncbi:MAG: efflux RND transporter permease subunit [Gemmatimonadales bacterium]|nr:MAG: efflux RND transporter permease subunit [Gemmatimonadales bacterium]